MRKKEIEEEENKKREMSIIRNMDFKLPLSSFNLKQIHEIRLALENNVNVSKLYDLSLPYYEMRERRKMEIKRRG